MVRKQIAICKKGRFYKLYPYSINQFGFWSAHRPGFCLETKCTFDSFVEHIAMCLQESNKKIFIKKVHDNIEGEELLANIHEKSWSAMRRLGKECDVSYNGTNFKIIPYI